MNKAILTVIILVLIGGGIALFHKRAQAPATVESTETADQVRARAWDVFTRYIAAAKAHDLKTLTALSYQLSNTCKNAASSSDCFKKMDNVVEVTKNFKEANFTTVWYDAKQIVMTTDWHEEETDLAFGDARNVIIFTRKDNGDPQVLYFTQPEEIIFTLKGKNDTKSMMRNELAPRLKDSDSDGLVDETEQCSYPNADKSCVKTDATKRDTDGNGWWDSTQSYFYK